MPSPAAQAPHKKPPTPAQLAHREKLKEYGRKGGSAPKTPREPKPLDEAQAHELIKEDWAEVSSKLVKQALKAAKHPEKVDGRSLVALTTAAGIAYDKRWSKQVNDNTEIAIPDALQAAVASKLAKPLNSNDSQNMIQAKSCSETKEGEADANPPVDPMLLSPGL